MISLDAIHVIYRLAYRLSGLKMCTVCLEQKTVQDYIWEHLMKYHTTVRITTII